MKFGESDYRSGALERLQESQTLIRSGQFAGGVYMAGRSVEGMLRAVLWRSDPEIQQGKKSLDTGHDLRRLLTLVRNLGLLRPGGRDDEFEEKVQRIARLWSNDMRFASTKWIEARWKKLDNVAKRRTLKRAAGEYFEDCSAIIKRCEILCQT